ncbi:GtrA family protein [Sinobaca sp. H24]|nr:GtrA family protein [Sinobaca sp. H24]
MLTTYNTVSYCLAVANSYIWNVLITFKDSAKGSNKQRMAFVLQGLVSLG